MKQSKRIKIKLINKALNKKRAIVKMKEKVASLKLN